MILPKLKTLAIANTPSLTMVGSASGQSALGSLGGPYISGLLTRKEDIIAYTGRETTAQHTVN